MRNTFLPFSPPLIEEEEINEVVDTLRSDWITTGPKTKKFEEEFKNYFNAPSALALNSCTAALHTALVTLGISAGDEVITTPMTFCASVNVIEHVGARPILVDVEADTLNIDPNKIENAITSKTKAIGWSFIISLSSSFVLSKISFFIILPIIYKISFIIISFIFGAE